MTFMYILSYVTLLIQVCFITLAIAAGLYYLAELVEEYTVAAKKTIKGLTFFTIAIYLLLLVLDGVPLGLFTFGLLTQLAHLWILVTFPYVQFVSVPFLSAVVLWLVDHYLALAYFQERFHPLSEVLAYFTVLWLVPFGLFVSLGANDNVLPTLNERTPLIENDMVSNYLSSRKKVGLLSLFQYMKESLLPQQGKKMF